jgi:hypothetical protein
LLVDFLKLETLNVTHNAQKPGGPQWRAALFGVHAELDCGYDCNSLGVWKPFKVFEWIFRTKYWLILHLCAFME